ncbi:AAA family ATPase [Mycobacterium sp. SA01]|uniref:AAA family ATPase n=1 Tax=Mycobacterium sp. SA01 TaxID=3238820 RepID=UPI00351BA94A
MWEGMARGSVEDQAVAELLHRAQDGPAVLLVEGEAGIGKTTLLFDAAERAKSLGFAVLTAHGSPAELGYAYAAVADLLSGIDDSSLAALPPRQQLALERARCGQHVEGPETDERTTATAFGRALEDLSVREPVLLTLDDAQWLDPSSRRVLGLVGQRLAGRTALLVTLRSNEGDPGDPTRATPFELPGASRVRMRPLDADGIHGVIAARLGRTLPRPVVTRIHRTSGGNPLFALELARAELNTATRTAGLPNGLAALVRDRLRRIGSEEQQVLLAAACAADPTVEVVSHAVDLPADAVLAAVGSAEALGVVALAGGRIRFSHPLFSTGVAANALPADRRAVHRALAETVNEPELRARHLALAATTGDETTLAAIDTGADVLAARGALAAAADLLELALTRGGDTPPRRIRAAELHFRSGSVTLARAHLQSTLDHLPPGVMRGLALAHLGAVMAYDDDLTGAIDALSEAAEEAAGAPALRLVCELRLALALAVAGRMAEAVERALRAIALAEDLETPGLRSQALALWVTAAFIQGQGVHEHALREAVQLEDPNSGATTFLRAGAVEAVISAYVGDLGTAEAQLQAVKRSMTAVGNEIDLVWVDNRLAAVAIWSGRYDLAEDWARAAVQRAEQLDARLSLVTAWTKRATVAAYRGRDHDARADAMAAIDTAHAIGARRQVKEPTRVLAFLEVSHGNYEDALAVLTPLLEEFDPPHELEIEGGEYLPDAVESLIALRHLQRAETVIDALEQHGCERDRPWMMAVGARGRGALLAARGDLVAAHRALDDAMVHHQRLAMPFERARTQLLLGQLQRRRRQRRDAAVTLSSALDTFDELGAPIWAERARTELKRLDATRSRGQHLTAAEHRIAGLAAQGLSNREIATELFLAEKTIDSTLSSVYRKLAIRSRAGLAVALNNIAGQVDL